MSPKFLGKYLLSGRVVCLTGLHIGGSTTGMEIGGVDNPVIKDPLTDEPVIPGSSLRGKLRTLTEWQLGLIEQHSKHKGFQAYACDELKQPCPKAGSSDYEKWRNAFAVARLYGAANDDTKVRATAGPTRLTVRDVFLTAASRKDLQKVLGQGTFTEVKTENSLDRVTSEANPRPLERVPAKSEFDLNLILDIYDADDTGLFKHLFTALSMLEQSSLGGGGSRGSGQVEFRDLQITWRSAEDYEAGNSGTLVIIPGHSVTEILKSLPTFQWPV
jgi:CRISPR-associated protein Csm3